MITRDEWLAALGEATTPADPDAVTVKEFSALMGMGRTAATARLELLEQNGKAVRVWKHGIRGRVRAYQLVRE